MILHLNEIEFHFPKNGLVEIGLDCSGETIFKYILTFSLFVIIFLKLGSDPLFEQTLLFRF